MTHVFDWNSLGLVKWVFGYIANHLALLAHDSAIAKFG